MNSRVEKYYDKNTEVGSRTARNSELYKEINKTELDNFEVRSNARVIGNNHGNIDVEKIKSILDTHYNDVPKRRTIQLEERPKEQLKTAFETKEYDINVILDKARESKEENYKEERARKLRDTQFDILSNLNIKREDFIEDYENEYEEREKPNSRGNSEAARKLEELINTIALNEKDIKKERCVENKQFSEESNTDPLDIFSDLKGSENTAILEGLQEKTANLIEQIEHTTSHDSSFFTKQDQFKKSDFEDFSDLEEKEGSGIFVKVIIALLVIVFIVGLIILVKSFL